MKDVEKGVWTYQKSEPVRPEKFTHDNGIYAHDTIPSHTTTGSITHSIVNKFGDGNKIDSRMKVDYANNASRSQERVLIIGGGFGGTVVAQLLKATGSFEVTMIDNKDYFEYKPSLPRLIQDPHHQKIITMDHKTFLKDVNFIESSVTQVVNNQGIHVHMGDGDFLSLYKDFDYLVICTGAAYSFDGMYLITTFNFCNTKLF